MNMKKFVARKAFPMICAAFISVVIAGCGDDSSNSTPSAPATTTPAVNPTDNSTTDPATNPTTDPATNPTTDPTTDPTTTDPSTTTDPVVTDPTTDPSTNPTDPTTDPTNPTVDPTTPTVSSFNRDPAAAGLAVTPDSTGFYDIGDVYKAVPATSKLVFVMRHAERQTSEGQESLLTEKGVEQALSVGAKLAGGDESFYYSSTDFIRTRETCNNIAKGRGETAEVVTWDGINGGYFLKVPSDTMDAFVRNRGGSWKFISSWAYDDPNPSRFTAAKIPEYLYELMPRGDQFVNEVVLANLPNWKRVSVLVSHDLLIEPLIAYASNRTVDLKFYESGKWANYLSGIAIVVDEANLVTLLPIRGIEYGFMYTEQRQAQLDSLAALQNP